MGLTQLGGEQMKQCEWQGEQCSRESGGRVCVNVVLICRAIKRVKGSRWADRNPSVSANELARFTAATRSGSRAAERRRAPEIMF